MLQALQILQGQEGMRHIHAAQDEEMQACTIIDNTLMYSRPHCPAAVLQCTLKRACQDVQIRLGQALTILQVVGAC